MAPKGKTATTKGTKRSSGDAASKPKAPRVDPAVKAVHDVLGAADDLPQSCKEMLLAMLPGSLCVTKDARSARQERVVEMLNEVVEAQKSSLKAALDAEVAKVDGLEASKGELDAKVAEAEAVLKEASDALASKRTVAQEAQQASKDAAALLKEAKAAEAASEETTTKIEADRKELQETLEQRLPSLLGDSFKPEAATEHRDAVMDVLKRSAQAFEATLLMTLPDALLKDPAERGDFDNMAIDTLKKSLGEHVERLGSELEAATAVKTERTAAVEAAAANFTGAQDKELAAEKERGDAEESEKAVVAPLEAAKAAWQNFDSTLASAAAERDAKNAALTRFEERTVAGFKSLQCAVAPMVEDAGKLGA